MTENNIFAAYSGRGYKMSNKLQLSTIIAFFFFLSLNLYGADNLPGRVLNPVEQINPDAPRYGLLKPIETTAPPFQKPSGELLNLGTPTTLTPPEYFCEFIDYSGGAAAYFIKCPDVWNDYEFGVRYTATAGYNCTLLTAFIGVYGTYMGGLPGGPPDMNITVYEDDGFGLPLTPLGSIVVSGSTLPTSGLAYVPVDLTTLGPLVFSDGEEYHVGVSVANFQDGDTLALLMDDGNQGVYRSWENWNGTYGYMLDDWGTDYNHVQGVDVCCAIIPYEDCYEFETAAEPVYYWQLPDEFGDEYYAIKFHPYYAWAETLIQFGLGIYEDGTVGTPDLDIIVWPCLSDGYPDMSQELARITIPFSQLVYYPEYTIVDFSALNLVFQQDFFVGWTINGDPGDTVAFLSDDGGYSRSFVYTDGDWHTMMDVYGIATDFSAYVKFCVDRHPYCQTVYDYHNIYYYWSLPDRYGDIGLYQKFSPLTYDCRLDKLRFMLYWPSSESEWPLYTFNSMIEIYYVGADELPGTLIFDTVLTPADYILYPGWTEIDFTNMVGQYTFSSDIWIGVRSLAPDTLTGIRLLSDDGTHGHRRSCTAWPDGSGGLEFGYIADYWDFDVNFVMEIDICCVEPPPPPPWCEPGELADWPVMGHDFARSFRTYSTLGDAQGALTKVWQYNADQVMVYASPVIWDEYIVGYFLDHLICLNKYDGSEVWKRTPDGFEIGGGCWATPTIYDFSVYGSGVYILTPGGDAKSFNCIDLYTGTTVWTRNFVDHSNHFLTFSPAVIVDCEGFPVCVYSDDDGDVYAVEALTGDLYAGWPVNPQNFGGSILQGITSDEENIYLGTDRNITNGNVTAVEACTGAIIWDLASAGGLQLSNVDPPNAGTEGFTGSILYTEQLGIPAIFSASYYDVVNVPPYKSGGVMYGINASDGSIVWAKPCIEHDYGGIAMDYSTIIHTGWTPWIPGYGELRGPTSLKMSNGTYEFKNTTTNPGLGDFWLMGGILSCEPEAPDWFITQSRNNFAGFYRDSDGAMMFHRRWSGVSPAPGVRAGHRTAPVMDESHLLLTWRNKIVALSSAANNPRPRLDIPKYTIDALVEFGLPDHYEVVYPDALGNTGGAPLTIDYLALADNSNNTIPPPSAPIKAVDIERTEHMQRTADKFAAGADRFRTAFKDIDRFEISGDKSATGHSAYTIPSWIHGIIHPFPGFQIPSQGSYNDSSNYTDIVIDVDGTQVPRGLTRFYVNIYTDDPDYFLDSSRIKPDGTLWEFPADSNKYMTPQIELGIIGGCLYDDVVMQFGVGASNYFHVWNSTKIADGDITSAEIDGDDVSFWQGAYIFAKNQTGDIPPGKGAQFSSRIYHYASDWGQGIPEWNSILPDPNCYNALCPPQLLTNVYLGEISTDDGASYHPVYGEMVAYAFVDSAQDMCNYDSLGNCLSWDWTISNPPYNDTLTAGFHGCAIAIAAYDEPSLNNFTIHRFDLKGRYGPVNDLFMGAMLDFDIPPDNKFNVCGYDAAHSLAYAYNCNTPENGWGAVKVPFGCGFTPMRGAKTVTAEQGGWNDTIIWLDSAYHWMSNMLGLSHQPGTDPAICAGDPDDREQFFSIAKLDLPGPGSEFTIGAAWFGMPNIADADNPATYFEKASTANKWCGFGRGDVNNDNLIDLVDIAYLIDFIFYDGKGPYPFKHLGDVDAEYDGTINELDIATLIDYYFNYEGCITGRWILGELTQ